MIGVGNELASRRQLSHRFLRGSSLATTHRFTEDDHHENVSEGLCLFRIRRYLPRSGRRSPRAGFREAVRSQGASGAGGGRVLRLPPPAYGRACPSPARSRRAAPRGGDRNRRRLEHRDSRRCLAGAGHRGRGTSALSERRDAGASRSETPGATRRLAQPPACHRRGRPRQDARLRRTTESRERLSDHGLWQRRRRMRLRRPRGDVRPLQLNHAIQPARRALSPPRSAHRPAQPVPGADDPFRTGLDGVARPLSGHAAAVWVRRDLLLDLPQSQ